MDDSNLLKLEIQHISDSSSRNLSIYPTKDREQHIYLRQENSTFDQLKSDYKNDDLFAICRICLGRCIDCTNLFTAEYTPSIIEKLLECTRISQISEDDGLPQNICGTCLNQLDSAYQFRILSEVSEHKLKSRTVAEIADKILEIDQIEQCDVDDNVIIADDNVIIADDDNVIVAHDDNVADEEIEITKQPDINCESWGLAPENQDNHQQAVLHQCETCGFTFDSTKALKKHIRCHVVAPMASRECKICSKVFKSEALLRAHGRTHSDLRPYICETCGKAFKTTSQLGSHCLTHSDVKNFQCPNCSYRGNTNNNLRIHLRTHTRVQPYSCRFCQWKFSTASNMQKHIRNIHHKMKTNQCAECEKSFFAKESLRKHMVTHTGIKLYSCSCCSASYAWYNGLKKHMRIQHPSDKCPSEITFRPTKTMY